MNSARIVYEPSADATPETESAALAAVYRIILDCRAKKKAAPSTRLPEALTLEPYKLQGTLWLLHYTNELAPEAEIAAAVEVARGDYSPEGAAA